MGTNFHKFIFICVSIFYITSCSVESTVDNYLVGTWGLYKSVQVDFTNSIVSQILFDKASFTPVVSYFDKYRQTLYSELTEDMFDKPHTFLIVESYENQNGTIKTTPLKMVTYSKQEYYWNPADSSLGPAIKISTKNETIIYADNQTYKQRITALSWEASKYKLMYTELTWKRKTYFPVDLIPMLN